MARIHVLSPDQLQPPDIRTHGTGNTDTAFVHSFAALESGPHVVISSLMHGNEYCGAIAVNHLLAAGIRPRRGRLSFVFCNIDAFDQFDPSYPALSRFVDEDMNRVWSPDILTGMADTIERRRAQTLWPLFATADRVLDLHSMQHDRVPLMLSGMNARARDLAFAVGIPGFIVADRGHAAGRRLIDHPRFADPDGGPMALLAECGQHWEQDSGAMALSITARFLLVTGCVDAAALHPWLPSADPAPPRLVEVTQTVTVENDHFRFVREFQGMDIIPHRGTLYAEDGDRPLVTPYDDCVLIMPTRLPLAGHTAVRLGRFRG